MTDTPRYIVDPAQADEVLSKLFNGLGLLWAGATHLTFSPEEAQAELMWNRLLHQVRSLLGEELVSHLEDSLRHAIATPISALPEATIQDDLGQ